MFNKHKVLHEERSFHDAIASKLKVDNNLAKNFLSYDSPGFYMANRLPRLKEKLLETLGDVRNKRVLVFGCGNDCAAVWFSKSGAIVDAIDISPKAIENQRIIAEKLSLKINAIVMDAHNLNLPLKEYDIVYGNAILHHLDLAEAVPEIVSVLKPEGKAIFRDVMKGHLFLRAFRFATPFWRTPDEHPLTSCDFDFLAQYFSTLQITEYILSGLPYFGFARIMNNVILKKLKVKSQLPLNDTIYQRFDRIDKLLFQLVPSLKKQAWICLIILTRPIHKSLDKNACSGETHASP